MTTIIKQQSFTIKNKVASPPCGNWFGEGQQRNTYESSESPDCIRSQIQQIFIRKLIYLWKIQCKQDKRFTSHENFSSWNIRFASKSRARFNWTPKNTQIEPWFSSK